MSLLNQTVLRVHRRKKMMRNNKKKGLCLKIWEDPYILTQIEIINLNSKKSNNYANIVRDAKY